uniref:Uncharacterized protein n=1 Tax=Anopheles melas TaxID=34690 RepID=A0A182UBF8_9DIPT
MRSACGRATIDPSAQPPPLPGNGCSALLAASPDSHDTAPMLPGRRDVGVGCNRLLGLAPLATACSSSAASSFYSSMLGAECSVSLRSRDRSSLTPGRSSQCGGLGTATTTRLATRFQHSKSHSIASSPRETTPVRNSLVIGVRGGSEKFSDRQKTASLPLPKRRQLSLNVPDTGNNATGVEEDGTVERPLSRTNLPAEETFQAGENCSFDTATSGLGGGGPLQTLDSSCTLNSNSYKEQYILGCGHYRSNLKHYDALLAGGGCVVERPHKADTGDDALVMVELGGDCKAQPNASQSERDAGRHEITEADDEKIATVQPKTHHYPTNAKSLEDIL